MLQAMTFAAMAAALVYLGYGVELLFLWILASRVALALLALVFVSLPHYPAKVTAQEDEYQATTIRQGWEWPTNTTICISELSPNSSPISNGSFL